MDCTEPELSLRFFVDDRDFPSRKVSTKPRALKVGSSLYLAIYKNPQAKSASSGFPERCSLGAIRHTRGLIEGSTERAKHNQLCATAEGVQSFLPGNEQITPLAHQGIPVVFMSKTRLAVVP